MSQLLWGWARQRGALLANLALLALQFALFPWDPDSTKFVPRVIDSMFLLVSYTAGTFILCFLLLRKRLLLALFVAQLVGTFLLAITIHKQFGLFDIVNRWMDGSLVVPVFDLQFVRASTSFGSQLGPFFYGLYAGIALLIYGNWFVRNRRLNDGYWKIDRQVIWTGLGVYGIINLLIWMFTHFSFVGSNYVNMESMMKYVDRVVDQYDQEDRRDLFAIRELRYFESFEQVKAFYGRPEFLARAGGNDRKDFYNAVYNRLDWLEKQGFRSPGDMSYDKMGRFHDWMSVLFNTNYNGVDSVAKKAWMLELSTAITNAPHWQDVTRHSLFYVKQRSNGHYYVYFSFDRSFKDYRSNYLFNVFFILFHLAFLPLFAYLVYLHRRENLKKSAIATALAGEEGK